MTTPGLVSFEASGLRWTAEGGCAELLERDVARRLDRLPDASETTLIKRNLVRTVLRVGLAPPPAGLGPVIVKRYAVRGVLDWLKYWIRPSRAAAEWRAGRALAAAGVPTAVPIAKAERWRIVLRDAALVVPEIGDSLRLDEFADRIAGRASEPAPLRAALFAELAHIVRRLHEAGIVHRDLHAGNVLVAGPDDAPRLHLIDLHSVRIRGAASRAQQRADLTKLLVSLRRHSTPEERRGLLTAYEAAGPHGSVASELLADADGPHGIEARLRERERRRHRGRTERSLARSSRFEISRADGYRVHHSRRIPAEGLVALVGDHREAAATVTRHVLRIDSASRGVIVRRYPPAGPRGSLPAPMRRPRAVGAWLAANGLAVRGLATAEPLALVLRRFGPLLREAYLVREDLGDEHRCDRVVLACARNPGPTARAEKRALVTAAGRFVAALHAAEVHAPSLVASSLFVRHSDAGAPEIVLADSDDVVFERSLGPRERVEALARLSASAPPCVSLPDRLRFFRAYAGADAALLGDWKSWFRSAAAAGARSEGGEGAA